jgi:hypothetical protein
VSGNRCLGQDGNADWAYHLTVRRLSLSFQS